MRKLLVAAALATFSAAPGQLHAQADAGIETIPGAPPAGAEDHGRGGRDHDHERGPHGPRLFISPSGEPFRGGDGLAAWFAQADADHDGSITPAEFQADAMRVFKLYDENGDGVIDGFEIQDYEHKQVPEISAIIVPGDEGGRRGGGEDGGRRRGGRRRGGGPESSGGGDRPQAAHTPGAGRDGAARFSLLNEPEPLLAADADVDGKVTLAEWTRATARRFAQLDKAHAGKLTMDALRPPKPKR